MGSIVWIVGSGASVALGGPTLRSLLSYEAGLEVGHLVDRDVEAGRRDTAPDVVGTAATFARRLYHYGTRYQFGGAPDGADISAMQNGGGQQLWSDAETYLDALETASLNVLNGPSWRLLNGILDRLKNQRGGGPTLSEIRDAARRAVAIECSKFLLDADTKQERWAPYRKWERLFRTAGNPTTIITFNYDRVLELLGLADFVVHPDSLDEDFEHKPLAILKLHGSVDWKRTEQDGEREYETKTDQRWPFIAKTEELVIATPGTGKLQVAQELEKLWTMAEARLKSAAAVVFLGYRFPPTDAMARERLLGALPEGNIPLHVVLGENVAHPDAARVRGLLEFARPRAWVRPLPLRAEDFIALATIDQILDNDLRRGGK